MVSEHGPVPFEGIDEFEINSIFNRCLSNGIFETLRDPGEKKYVKTILFVKGCAILRMRIHAYIAVSSQLSLARKPVVYSMLQ